MPDTASLPGLSQEEAKRRIQQYGANQITPTTANPWIALVSKFWAPVPWILEVTIVLQCLLGKTIEAVVMGVLLVFNALLSVSQEHRANQALALLQARLDIRSRVLRDQTWQSIPATGLVPGDVIYLRMGDMVPADTQLGDGEILLDQSTLTGESLPVNHRAPDTIYAGAMVRRGEARGTVTATGSRTQFGKTASLVSTAHPVSHMQTLIFSIVRYLVILDIILVAILVIYALIVGTPLTEIIPFSLMLLIASVPIALPATYTLSTALGAVELAQHGVLVTRLSAIEDAATMDILASDKTGTLTQNTLTVASTIALPPFDTTRLLRWAAIASDHATQDPLDLAILNAASADTRHPLPDKLTFIPFSPDTKRSQAQFIEQGITLQVSKGAPQVITALVDHAPDIHQHIDDMGKQGMRVLAVSINAPDQPPKLVGLIGLTDPPRADSAALISQLQALGIRVMMVSGDGAATACAIAKQIGLGERVCPPENQQDSIAQHVFDYDVFARVLPEDKYLLVQSLQRAGHIVGMSGDGVNDAPALKQAEIGIAVADATDVAKAAASLVLTNPGLSDIRHAVVSSRRIYQRMLTYTLNKIIKTLQISAFLSLGLLFTDTFVITPMLMVLLLFTNDFATMSIAGDNAKGSSQPERWRIPTLMTIACILAGCLLILSFGVFFYARDWLHLPLGQLQTVIFLMLVFSGQGTIYLVRERGPFWHSMPGVWLLRSSVIDILIVIVFATQGIFMTAIPSVLIAEVLAVVVMWLLLVDVIKIRVFQYFGY